jgi:major membrane immunogen (membrane-anchored lipoprotein)
MLKNIFLILSICILLFGCNSSKKTTDFSMNHEGIGVKEESNEYEEEWRVRLEMEMQKYDPQNYPIIEYNTEFSSLNVWHDGNDLEFIEEYSF